MLTDEQRTGVYEQAAIASEARVVELEKARQRDRKRLRWVLGWGKKLRDWGRSWRRVARNWRRERDKLQLERDELQRLVPEADVVEKLAEMADFAISNYSAGIPYKDMTAYSEEPVAWLNAIREYRKQT